MPISSVAAQALVCSKNAVKFIDRYMNVQIMDTCLRYETGDRTKKLLLYMHLSIIV